MGGTFYILGMKTLALAMLELPWILTVLDTFNLANKTYNSEIIFVYTCWTGENLKNCLGEKMNSLLWERKLEPKIVGKTRQKTRKDKWEALLRLLSVVDLAKLSDDAQN